MTYIAVSALSHIGAMRDHHEDSLVAGPWTLCATVTESPQTLFFPLGTPLVIAVADGLGGHPGGEVASALVVRELAQVGPLLNSEDKVREALIARNGEVHAAAARDPALTAMGTTVAGVVVTADLVLAFNVGDSRVYAAGRGGVRQLSTDDRLPADDLPPGIVTQALGGSNELAVVDPH
ncbi:MAG: PP2C family protein-serine/threonine phosphatase [Micromonosporaceae bacterium]